MFWVQVGIGIMCPYPLSWKLALKLFLIGTWHCPSGKHISTYMPRGKGGTAAKWPATAHTHALHPGDSSSSQVQLATTEKFFPLGAQMFWTRVFCCKGCCQYLPVIEIPVSFTLGCFMLYRRVFCPTSCASHLIIALNIPIFKAVTPTSWSHGGQGSQGGVEIGLCASKIFPPTPSSSEDFLIL